MKLWERVRAIEKRRDSQASKVRRLRLEISELKRIGRKEDIRYFQARSIGGLHARSVAIFLAFNGCRKFKGKELSKIFGISRHRIYEIASHLKWKLQHGRYEENPLRELKKEMFE